MKKITDALIGLGKRDDVWVIVLASVGKSFCAAVDVHWTKQMMDYSFAENVADANLLARMLRTIRACPKPVIARIHGAAIGGSTGNSTEPVEAGTSDLIRQRRCAFTASAVR